MSSERERALEACLRELLRLYDLRFEIGAREKANESASSSTTSKEIERDLRRYGHEKKAAWVRARELLK